MFGSWKTKTKDLNAEREREKIGIRQNKYRKRKRDEMRKKERKCYNRGMRSACAYHWTDHSDK